MDSKETTNWQLKLFRTQVVFKLTQKGIQY